MSDRRFDSYEEFWPFYVREHSDKTNRRLHFVGTSGTIACWIAAVVKRDPKFLLYSALSGYGGAWIGHFFFQKNKPATFKYPLWSLISDFRMYGKILNGTMEGEVARVIEEEERKAREEQEQAAQAPKSEPERRPQDLN
jgi:hypothetical protein